MVAYTVTHYVELLQALCPIPSEADAVLSETDWRRWHHLDLEDFTRGELLQQRRQAELRLPFERLTDPPSAAVVWLTDRLEQIAKALRRR